MFKNQARIEVWDANCLESEQSVNNFHFILAASELP
ncbi:hypothetical protein QE396_004464, partial [Enterobacter sp. SORGH_AS 287]|nr:hypothetical protein [Enterobacter sp. SORGH_AS_0287]